MIHQIASCSSESATPSTSSIIAPMAPMSPVSIAPAPTPPTPLIVPRPRRMELLHVEAPRGAHKLFISAGPPPAIGFFFHVIHIPGPYQPAMVRAEDVVRSINDLGPIGSCKVVGTFAVTDLPRLRSLINRNRVPLSPTDSDRPGEDLRRARLWVYDVINALTEDGIVELPPPPPPARSHDAPRHHHTPNCIHQRLYNHHPYRRRERQPLLTNGLMTTSGCSPSTLSIPR
ncbi:hypothetical protein ACJ41O_010114 [Fusarium nematophilum]